MIKIKKRGYKADICCKHCGCEFSFEKEDILGKPDKLFEPSGDYVKCPQCDETIWIGRYSEEDQRKESKIVIYNNPNGDTRTADKDVTFEEFQKANDMHIQDVQRVMNRLSEKVIEAGHKHDYTKKTKEELFYNNFCDTLDNGTDFVKNDWYQLHVHTERHHLLSHCKEDVNLIDVIEMISDCVCAGMTRSGEIRDLEISPEILTKAVNNTANMIKEMIEVKEG